MSTNSGTNLIFLISQPRAGSTLLQRMLSSHPDIHTLSEPWLMLHPVYSLRDDGIKCDYGHALYREAVQEFISALPNKREDYIEGIRRMYGYLYDKVLSTSNKKFFLDKTPRYYFIIPELKEIFPDSHLIFLLRTPLAVLVSILNTWVRGNWQRIRNFYFDLVEAPRMMLEGIRNCGSSDIVIRYEQMLEKPQENMMKICEKIGVQFYPQMVNYGDTEVPRWKYGDQKKVYTEKRPDASYADEWAKHLSNPQTWVFCRDYLNMLGDTLIEDMGYSYKQHEDLLANYKPSRWKILFAKRLLQFF
jgi:hypothetical protein